MAENSKEKSEEDKKLKAQYFEELNGMTNWMIKVPTYDQWLAMKEKSINFKKYSNI